MIRLVAFCIGLFVSAPLLSQFCGTPQEPLLERTDQNKKAVIPVQRGVPKYIPVTFHLVAATNGTGRVVEEAVLAQLATLNDQFADQEVIFYIDSLSYFNNDAVFNTPSSSAARSQMRLREISNSVNIFITNTADSGSGGPGVTLAYYDPQEDWIVCRKAQIGAGSSTMAHELGHYFSLAHPHAGWDCHPYTTDDYTNPVNVNFTIPCDGGGGSLLIELRDRSNCNTAGDRICDTPEDYNLGLFYQNDCDENTDIRDKNGELIQPMTNNFMGYYRNCANYAFTTTQKNLMNTDYFSFQRNHLRTGFIPDLTPVTEQVQYINYINGEETPGITAIHLDWEDVPGADKYLVVYDRLASFTFNPVREIVEASEFTIDGPLNNGVLYYWRVWPFNDSQAGAGFSPTQNFRVGTGVGINEISDINDYAIIPNPVSGAATALLTLTSANAFSGVLALTNMSGQVVAEQRLDIPAGMSQQMIPSSGLPAGIYIITLHTTAGRLVERLMIMD